MERADWDIRIENPIGLIAERRAERPAEDAIVEREDADIGLGAASAVSSAEGALNAAK